MSTPQAAARKFDQRRKRKADRTRLLGTRRPHQDDVAPEPEISGRRASIAAALRRRAGATPAVRGAAPPARVAVRPQRIATLKDAASAPPEAPLSVLEEFRAGFDRLDATIREGLGLASQSELDELNARNEHLETVLAEQQQDLANRAAEIDRLRAELDSTQEPAPAPAPAQVKVVAEAVAPLPTAEVAEEAPAEAADDEPAETP